METGSAASSSSSNESTLRSPDVNGFQSSKGNQSIPGVSKSPNANGYLFLEGNPRLWIDDNPTSSHLLVKHLKLEFHCTREHEYQIGDNIEKLTLLTHLTITRATHLKRLPHSMSRLHNLQFLKFECCKFNELPPNLGVLKISLTHLSLKEWSITSLPESVGTLYNLAFLDLEYCYNFTDWPESFGQLHRLKQISLEYCDALQSLPNSLSNLLHLETLRIKHCPNLTELPANLKVTYLQIISCSKIHFIPSGLSSLRHLEVTPSLCSQGSFANLKNSVNLHQLFIVYEGFDESAKVTANLDQLLNLQILSFCGLFSEVLDELPANLEGLDELIILDIQGTSIKYLPWSITKLTKLRFLMLPSKFRLETLPFHLSDSVLISVEGRHLRETWKQLKQELNVPSVPDVAVPCPSSILPPGYLRLSQMDIVQWVCNNKNSLMLVKMLDLEESSNFDGESAKHALGELSKLTHLYICDSSTTCWVLDTVTWLRHMSLDSCFRELKLGDLAKLSNLETLETWTKLPENTDLPVSLRRLSIHAYKTDSLPNSLAKLSNLITLELGACEDLNSLPENLNIVRLKLVRIINPLPVRLRHLEIVHCCDGLNFPYCEGLDQSLTLLVNLETLSVTCHYIKSLPSISRLHKVQVLKLKDCFSLIQLPSDVDELIELNTIDISGTRIKFLPDSIVKLPKLHCVILPKCFRQKKLLRNLQRFSIDDTNDLYYKHMNYYDCRYGNPPDTGCEDDDFVPGSNTEKKDCLAREECEQGVAGAVSMSTMNRINDEQGLILSSSKKRKKCHDEKEDGGPKTVLTCLGKPSKPSDGLEHKVSRGATATMATIEKPPLGSNKVSHMVVFQHAEEQFDGANHSDVAQLNRISNSFDFVKACYEGDSVWIKMSLTSSFDQLNQSVCMKFRLKVNTFKIKYFDEDKEWLLMTCVSDLTHALLYTSSSGRQFVRLYVTITGVVNTEVLLDGATQSDTAQPNGSSSSFDFVKACYEGDQVWIAISFTSSFDQLNESVCKKFRLEVDKIKIKYLDEDKEWSLMTCISDLTHALLHTSSSGRKFVMLNITVTGVVSRGRASAVNLEPIIPEISKGRSTWMPIISEREISNYNQHAGENINQHLNRDYTPFFEFCLPHIKPLIEGHVNVKLDGNCGFRVIATFEYGNEERWLDVRIDLSKELNSNMELYKKALGGDEEFDRANSIVNWLISPANKMHWFEATCLGLVVATKYQKVFTCWSTESCTYLPLESRLVDHKPPTMFINMARIKGNHFIALQMATNSPLPPLSPLWKWHCRDTVKHWSTSIFKKQLDDYL